MSTNPLQQIQQLQSPARQPKPPKPVVNPHEQLERTDSDNHVKVAAQQIADVPGQIATDVKDNFIAALYGVPASEIAAKRQEAKQEQDSFTKLNYEKLQDAYARNDQDAVARIQNKLQEHAQEKKEHVGGHKAYAAEVDRAIAERKREEQERQKAIEEEEARKRQEEQQAAAANQDMGGGQGKAKGRLGAPRKKASTDTNFEAGQGKNGK